MGKSLFALHIEEIATAAVKDYFASPAFDAVIKEAVLQGALQAWAPGREAEADRFIGHIAHRYYQRAQITMTQARQIAERMFFAHLREEKVRFGHGDYAWTPESAAEIADEDLEHWEAA